MLRVRKIRQYLLLAVLCSLALVSQASAEHAEAEGLVLRMGGEDIVTVWQGVVTGEIEVHHDEFTDPVEVFFLEADSTLFQPDEPEFSLGAVVGTPATAGFDSLSQWTFRLEGLIEDMTDITLSLLHEGHSDFTTPAIEVHVEEHHAEADGLVLRMGGADIVTVWQGVVTGEIEVHHDEFTDPIEVFFLEADSTLFQPDEPEFTLGAVLGNPATVGYEALSQWSFRLEGIIEDMTDITLSILHEGHADFSSPAIEVHVEEHHAEADGLVLRMGGADIVTVWQGVVTGEIEVHHDEFTDPIEVFFLEADSTLFQPDEPEFTLGAVLGNPATVGYEALSQWSFRLEGLVEDMTDITLSILHEGHADFSSPAIEVHVEEHHAEADGLVLRMGGADLVTVWQGVVTGQVVVPSNFMTEEIEVFFLEADSTLFQPDEPEFTLGVLIGDPATVGYEALSQWSFRLTGLVAGMTDITLSIVHEGHADFSTPLIPVSVQAVSDVPFVSTAEFNVMPNHPNPFNPTTEIRFRLPSDLAVSVRVYDVTGRLVNTLLANEIRQAGENTVTWRGVDDAGRAVGSGVYFYRVDAGTYHGVSKMTLLK